MTGRQGIDRAAAALAVLVLGLGILTPITGRIDLGVRLVMTNGRVVVADVNPNSVAAFSGMETGMVVVSLDGRQLVQLPAYVYPSPGATPDPDTGAVPQASPIGIVPPAPVDAAIDPSVVAALVAGPITSVGAVTAEDFAAGRPDATSWGVDDGYLASELRSSLGTVMLGMLLLFGTAWLLGSGRAGPALRELAQPAALAFGAVYLLKPLTITGSPIGTALFSVLLPVSLLPLGLALVARIEPGDERRLAILAVGACTAGAIAIGVSRLGGSVGRESVVALVGLAGGVTAFPGFVAAGPFRPRAWAPKPAGPSGETVASGRVVRSTELTVVGLTPCLAIADGIGAYGFVLPLWIAAVVIAARLTVRPLARLASRAQLQRDLVVAATEAERARVAADIHDDALQELTLLVRRLDAAGDAEGASLARGVSDRLRAICGDLRLPILDDLGVGPALDWLVLRIERLAGGEVRLERSDGTRPPPDVELAFFRVAQEALSNAVKHGRPPIVVRYRSTDAGASLSIDDAGQGIPTDAGDRAEREGHFGLLNMEQRAEGIGAILDVRRWPAGGTHVQLEWRPR